METVRCDEKRRRATLSDAARLSITCRAYRTLSGSGRRGSFLLWRGSRTSRRSRRNLRRAPCAPCRDTCRCIRGSRLRWPTGGSCRSGRWAGPSPGRRPVPCIRDGRVHGPFRLPRWSGTRRRHRCSLRRRPFVRNRDSGGWPGFRPRTRLSGCRGSWSSSGTPFGPPCFEKSSGGAGHPASATAAKDAAWETPSQQFRIVLKRISVPPEANNDIHAVDRHAFGRGRNAGNFYGGTRNVDQHPFVFDIKVLVLVDIGVEVGPPRLDRNLFQQVRLGELVQRVVDGGKRYPDTRLVRLLVEGFSGQVAVLVLEQEVGKSDALLGRAQARGPQALCGLPIPLSGGWARTTHLSEPYAFPKPLAADTLSSSLLRCS